MRIAALYDIHGNLPALEAVIAELRLLKIDHIVIGGDVIPGPMPRECLDLLDSLDIPMSFIIGNGDREALAFRRGDESGPIPAMFRDAMRWNAAQLDEEDALAIAEWPAMVRLSADGAGAGDVLFCHATPRNDTEIFLKTTAEETLKPIIDPLNVQLLVCGHTHMQFDRMIGTTRVVNAGSVGMPFQEPGAYWLLIDTSITLMRTNYDLIAAAARVRATQYPQAEEFAAKSILTAPSEPAMLAALTAAEIKS